MNHHILEIQKKRRKWIINSKMHCKLVGKVGVHDDFRNHICSMRNGRSGGPARHLCLIRGPEVCSEILKTNLMICSANYPLRL